MLHQIRMVRCIEEICETFGYNEPKQPCQMGDEQIQMYVNAFAARIDQSRLDLATASVSEGALLEALPTIEIMC